MKKVYKYGTGQEIPEGAEYLATVANGDINGEGGITNSHYPPMYKFVWHYFLVEIKE